MQPSEIKSYIGIDVSKMHLDICILPQGERFQIENNPQGKFKVLSTMEKIVHKTNRYGIHGWL
jgi:hypothetical protein